MPPDTCHPYFRRYGLSIYSTWFYSWNKRKNWSSRIYDEKSSKISIKDGTEIWNITRDGRQTLYAVFENKTFKIVDQ